MKYYLNIAPYQITPERTENKTLNKAIASFRLKHRLRMAFLDQHADQENWLSTLAV